jgi:ADP-L-glycero-D-manno-heptose 6-epimerase
VRARPSVQADRESGEVLVTGAAGFLGAHMARTCNDAGCQVTALDIRELPADIRAHAHEVQGEADYPRVLADLRAGRYQAVIHQGGISNTLENDWKKLWRVNVLQSLTLAEAGARSGAIFIYASSHSVYGTLYHRLAVAEHSEGDRAICSGPLNLYARSKLLLDEQMAAQFGADTAWVGLRYTNVFGTGETHKGAMASIISQLLLRTARGEPLRLFADTLNACRDYVPVETVVGAVRSILARRIPSGVYNLGSGQPTSFATLLEWCAAFREPEGLRVQLVPNPIPDRYQYWTCADQSKLDAVLPGRPALTQGDIRLAAQRLFEHYLSLMVPAHAGRPA